MEDLFNLSLEQRRETMAEARNELGRTMEVLRFTGWNPFADDAPSQSAADVDQFFLGEEDMFVNGKYFYAENRGGIKTGLIPGEYRHMTIDKQGLPLIKGLCDIRTPEGKRIQYVEFDGSVAGIVGDIDEHSNLAQLAQETYWGSYRRKPGQVDKRLVFGVYKVPNGEDELFVEFAHIGYETVQMMRTPYKIPLQDYINGLIPDESVFAISGIQEMIAVIDSMIPEIFISDSPRQGVVAHGTDDVVFEGDGDGNLESAEVIDDELLTYIRYSLACKRYEDVASELVYLANNKLVDNKTGFAEEELYQKIRTGWVVVYEREEEITLLPFTLHEQDKVVLRNSGNGIETDDDIVANISRVRVWVQRGRYEDYRMETPEEIDAEEVYDLLKRGYVDFTDVMDRVMKSVWPIPGMSSEMTLDKIAECIHFGLNSGTLKAKLVEGVCGPEYKLITTGWESEEDVEVLTRHFNRLELMSNIARPQDYNGSLRAMLEAGEISDLTEIPYSGIEFYVAMGELEYSPLNESVRYMRYPADPETEEVRIGMGLSRPEEVLENFARRRLEYTKVGYIDKRENIPSEIDTSKLGILLEKGYINVLGIEDLFIGNADLFELDDQSQFRSEVATIIRNGLVSGDFTSELIEGRYGLEYVITRKVQDESASGSVPLPQFPTLSGLAPSARLMNTLNTDGRLPVRNGEDEIANLEVVKIDEVEEKFGVSVEALKERIANVVDRPTRHGLIRAGMWSNLEPNKLNPIAGKEIELTTYPQGELRVNTAIVYSYEKDKEGIVGVLTDVDTTNPDYIKTMVVDFRRVESNGHTRLIATCLQNDIARRNIVLPTVEDGGYVFELVFEGSDVKFDPRVVWDALQGLDLKDNTPRSEYKLNRYKLEK